MAKRKKKNAPSIHIAETAMRSFKQFRLETGKHLSVINSHKMRYKNLYLSERKCNLYHRSLFITHKRMAVCSLRKFKPIRKDALYELSNICYWMKEVENGFGPHVDYKTLEVEHKRMQKIRKEAQIALHSIYIVFQHNLQQINDHYEKYKSSDGYKDLETQYQINIAKSPWHHAASYNAWLNDSLERSLNE